MFKFSKGEVRIFAPTRVIWDGGGGKVPFSLSLISPFCLIFINFSLFAEIMDVVGSIIARLGSKQLAYKNLMPFEGKPLWGLGIEKLRVAERVDEIVVSTEILLADGALEAVLLGVGEHVTLEMPVGHKHLGTVGTGQTYVTALNTAHGFIAFAIVFTI